MSLPPDHSGPSDSEFSGLSNSTTLFLSRFMPYLPFHGYTLHDLIGALQKIETAHEHGTSCALDANETHAIEDCILLVRPDLYPEQ